MKQIFFYTAALAFMAAAVARESDGALDLIQTPNNGMPVMVASGGSFDAMLTQRADLQLVDASGVTSGPLVAQWTERPGGVFLARCIVPAETPPGFYTIQAVTGGKSDQNSRAVYVYKEFPEYYVIAHVTDIHIDSGEQREASIARFRAILDSINQSDAAFVLLTGDLTNTGAPEEFQRFSEALDTCALPTFVCPGNHDRQGLNYEHYFGPLVYRFRFGLDGFLMFDTKDFLVADTLGEQDGALYMFRRELKPCRWTFGATHRYEAMMGMRSQLTLFVDEPIDFLLFGHLHREGTKEDAIPWGATKVVVTPSAREGSYRLIDVAIGGILARPVQQLAK